MNQPNFTQNRLKQLIHYNKVSGEFYWKSTIGGRRKNGPAGTIWADGSIHIGVQGKVYSAHRLAWFYMKGAWPEEWMTHKNGDRGDNRWRNLAERTQRREKFSSNEVEKFNKTTKYEFNVSKEDGVYLATCTVDKENDKLHKFVTQGRSKEEILVMVADAFMTVEGVKVSWWNKLVNKFFIYK